MQEKSELPSQHRLKKAREKGEVAKSGELAAALIIAGALLILWGCSELIVTRLRLVFTEVYSQLDRLEWDEALGMALGPVVVPILAVMGGIFGIAVLAHLGQTGLIWAKSKGKAKMPWFLQCLKWGLISAIGYMSLKSVRPSLEDPQLMHVALNLLLRVAGALVVVGVCDLIYQRWKHLQKMRMSKQELKDEKRMLEGDVETKSRMKQR